MVLVHAVANSIALGIMRVAIHLYDKALLGTEKVDNALADDMLASELEAVEL